METKTNVVQPAEFIIPKETFWHFERKLKPDDKKVDNYVLIQPGAPDVVKVLQAYTHHPVSAYDIASIEIVYNEALNRQFLGNMQLMKRMHIFAGEEWKALTYDFETNYLAKSIRY